MKKDRISVALATYNGEQYLREQLDSIYRQTRIPDEIVVSDDGSNDGTISILEEYHQIYGLRYSINEGKHGVNSNFEKAIRACNGDYIIICDQDDIWFPNKIEKTYSKIKEIEGDKPAVVSSQCYHIDSKGTVISKKTNIKKDSHGCVDTILQPPGTNTQGSSMMFNRALLKRLKSFPNTQLCMYDAYIGFICSSIGIKYNMAIPLMYYRHHENNVVCRFNKTKDSFLKKMTKSFIDYVGPLKIPRKRRESLLLIRKEYGDFFDYEISSLYDNVLAYLSEKKIAKRLRVILKIHQLSLKNKIRLMLGTLLYRNETEYL